MYHDMLQFCREKRIGAGLILMPEHSRLRNWYTPASEQRLQTALKDLGMKFGAPVIDARAWMSDENFVDGVHLTHQGASAFTQLFDTKVIRPVITPKLTASNR